MLKGVLQCVVVSFSVLQHVSCRFRCVVAAADVLQRHYNSAAMYLQCIVYCSTSAAAFLHGIFDPVVFQCVSVCFAVCAGVCCSVCCSACCSVLK